MKNIAVIGARGMLGYAVSEYFERRGDAVISLSRDDFDIARDPIQELAVLLGDARYVINCAGVIKPRIAEMTLENVLKVNAIFPHNLARLCDGTGRVMFHVTTDCVYTGNGGGYDESDYFDADDIYGLSKNAGDTADCMVLRTSIIGEERGEGRSLLEWARSEAGNRINGFVNHYWNGVTTLHLAEIIERIIEDDLYARGVFHIHSPETVDKRELLNLINDFYELGLTINPLDAPTSCDRSLNSLHDLSSTVATKSLGQQLQEMRDFFSA